MRLTESSQRTYLYLYLCVTCVRAAIHTPYVRHSVYTRYVRCSNALSVDL